MDPDQLLIDIRLLSERIKRLIDEHKYEPGEDIDLDDAFRESADVLADKVLALDQWLRMAGFLPKAWATGRVKAEPSTEQQ